MTDTLRRVKRSSIHSAPRGTERPPSARPKPRPAPATARVVYHYDAQDVDELTITVGDVIEILQEGTGSLGCFYPKSSPISMREYIST